MKKAFLLTVILVFCCRTFFSQTNYQHGFLSFGTNVAEKNNRPNYQLYKQQLHKKYDTLFSKVEDCNYFVKSLISDLRSDFENGEVYVNWDYAQNYLNKVFNKVIPGANPDSINIKIIRSADVNAMMTGTGQAYITVGFLANALNEAEIAGTLGHEYGHYIHLDLYKTFNEYLKNETHRKVGNMLGGIGGSIYKGVSTSNMYEGFKDMERDADNTGAELAKQANYNLLARVNVLKRYKIIEDNNKRDKDYRIGIGIYYSSHPPTQERINTMQKDANGSDTINAKYFQVDESLFNKIKLQAVDECINLLLQQQEFEDCIELCYKQLLFNPTDEFYLFYLNEALRRYITVKPLEADDFFITGRYNTYTKYVPKNKLPVYVNSEKELKPADQKVTQTIFYHYEYLTLADKDRLFVNLPDNNLTRTDTLEFVTNKDALKYFIALQEKLKQSSVNWVKNCLANTLNGVTINSAEPFLNKYNNIQKDVLTCVTASSDNVLTPCVLSGISYSGRSSFVSRSDFKSDYLYEQCGYYFKTNLATPFTYFDLTTLTPSEKNAVYNFITGMKITVKEHSKKSEVIETAYLPLTSLAPEIIAILNKYKLQKFMVISMRVTDAVSTGFMSLSYTLTSNIYCIDLKSGFLSHTVEKHSMANSGDLEREVKRLNETMPLLQNQK